MVPAGSALVVQAVKNACNAGDSDSIPGLGRFPAEGHGNPLQYSCLENSKDRGAWRATVHGVTKSRTWLSDSHFHFLSSTVDSASMQTQHWSLGALQPHQQRPHPMALHTHGAAPSQNHHPHPARASHPHAVTLFLHQNQSVQNERWLLPQAHRHQSKATKNTNPEQTLLNPAPPNTHWVLPLGILLVQSSNFSLSPGLIPWRKRKKLKFLYN